MVCKWACGKWAAVCGAGLKAALEDFLMSGVERRICRCHMQKASNSCSLEIFENGEIKLAFQFFVAVYVNPSNMNMAACLQTD